MKKRSFLFFIFFNSALSFAQENAILTTYDTLKPNERTVKRFDSLDVFLSPRISATPFLLSPLFSSPKQFFNPFEHSTFEKSLYSAIPHVGLNYSIGSKNTQFAQLNYSQAFSKNVQLSLVFQRLSSNGLLQAFNYDRNKFSGNLLIQKGRRMHLFKLSYTSFSQAQNKGLESDTLVENLSLNLQSVKTVDAFTKKVSFCFSNSNFFSFTKDSIKQIGVILQPSIRISNRRFTETGAINILYSLVNFDTIKTNDYWEQRIANFASGLYYKNATTLITVAPRFSYWDFQNRNNASDSLEIWADFEIEKLFPKGGEVQFFAKQNIKGAGQGSLAQVQLKKKLKVIDFSLKIDYSSILPDVFQRNLIANNYSYTWQNKVKTTALNSCAQMTLMNNYLPVQIQIEHSLWKNKTWFLNNEWRQDTLTNIQFTQLKLRFDYVLKKWFFQPNLDLTLQQINVFPLAKIGVRTGFNLNLLKSKKLKTSFGIDLIYTSSYQLSEYSLFGDVMMLGSTNSQKNYFRASAFMQYDLGFFRWFIRGENLNLIGQLPKTFELKNYPTNPFLLRFGISWDLFN